MKNKDEKEINIVRSIHNPFNALKHAFHVKKIFRNRVNYFTGNSSRTYYTDIPLGNNHLCSAGA